MLKTYCQAGTKFSTVIQNSTYLYKLNTVTEQLFLLFYKILMCIIIRSLMKMDINTDTSY